MVSYRGARKLSSYLVRAKLYPLERKRGSYKYGNSRCQVHNNIEEIDTFTCTITSESFKISHHLCCNDKCLIYLLTCKVCKNDIQEKHLIDIKFPAANGKLGIFFRPFY